MENDECVPISCTISADEFPIHDTQNMLSKTDQGADNPAYNKPLNVEEGDCAKFRAPEYVRDKVPSGESCPLVIGRGMGRRGLTVRRQRARSLQAQFETMTFSYVNFRVGMPSLTLFTA